MHDDELLTRKQWTREFGISDRTGARYDALGIGPPRIKLSRKVVRYRRSAVTAWLRAMEREQPRAPRVKVGE